jgi:hypothetical protein
MIFRSQTYLIATASIIALSLLPVSAGVGPIRAESRLLAAQSASQSAADQGSGDKRDGSHDFDLLFTECYESTESDHSNARGYSLVAAETRA